MEFSIASLLVLFNKYFTLSFVVPGLLLFGMFLTWKLRCVQLTRLKMGFKTLAEPSSAGDVGSGDISHYQSIATVLASNFGTGNISGMAVALAMGGAGSLFWMWVMTFFGAAIQFANSFLGVKYRTKNERGEYVGGPMYYMRDGLGWKKSAAIYAILVILGAFPIGSFVQVNSVALPLVQLGLSPWLIGIGMAILVGLVILGGMNRIASVSSAVVPVMAFLYLGGAIFTICYFHDQFFNVLGLVVGSAFGMKSAVGGLLGFSVMKAVAFGFNRAIFATDAGTGLVPILQSGSKTKHPVIDGVVTLVAPFLVMVVCSATLLALLASGSLASGLESTNMVIHSFSQSLGKAGIYIVLIALFLFGFTTTIGWSACMDRAVEYLMGQRWIKTFRLLYIVSVPIGALLQVNFVWILADVVLTTALVINVAAVLGLSKEVIADHDQFFFSKIKAPVK